MCWHTAGVAVLSMSQFTAVLPTLVANAVSVTTMTLILQDFSHIPILGVEAEPIDI